MINRLKQPKSTDQSSMLHEQADNIAVDALLFLTQDENELFAFMNESGLLLADLRQRIHDRNVMGGLLDYILADTKRLENFSQAYQHQPEIIVRARMTMPGFSSEMRTVY